jgi:hypothetical protein
MLASAMIDKIIGWDRVSGIVQDPFYTGPMILDLLNEAQLSVAGGGDRPHHLPLLAPLPELSSSGTVTLAVDTQSVALPVTYHRNLFFVTDSSGYKLTLMNSHTEFLTKYPKLEAGETRNYIVKGLSLYYAPAKAQDITVNFYRLPVDMTDDGTSEPDGVPVHLQERLLVSHVLYSIFAEIEDGMQGRKSNTDYWYSRHQAALTDLERMIGPEDREPMNISDTSNYIFNIGE